MVRLGLLSTAAINTEIVRAAALVRNVEVAAIASRDEACARAQADELGVVRALGSYEALLRDAEIDAIYISLPNSLHMEWARRALHAGKHVLCEKPLSASAEEVDAVFSAAERAGLVMTEGFMWRHHPQVARLRELLPRIGALRSVRAEFSFALDAATLAGGSDIRLQPDLAGGALMDVGCYCLSGVRLAAGEPIAVTAQQTTLHGVDVRFAATLEFADGVLGHFGCAIDTADRSELEICGSERTLVLRDPWMAEHPVIEITGPDGPVVREDIDSDNAYARELENFAAAIVHGKPPLLGRDDAVAQARGLAALRAAASLGQRIAVEPAGP